MESFKPWVIIGFYAIFVSLVLGFSVYLRQTRGESLYGSFDFSSIPRKLIWMPIMATLSLLFIMVFSIVYAFNPEVINRVFPLKFLMSPIIDAIGIMFIIIGLVIVGLSQFHLGTSYRIMVPEEETKLVTSGIYSLCRNPLYMGSYLSFFGLFLMMPNVIYLIGFAFGLLNNHFRILEEEKYLSQAFSGEYDDYCARVGRYGPKLSKSS